MTVEELGDELLVYDLNTDRAHSLSPVAARVWRACDGRTAATALADQLDLEPDQVTRALDELGTCDLLAPGAHGGLSRRELSVRVAKGAVAAASAPLIISIMAPTPAAAQSVIPGCEDIGNPICSGNCGNATGCGNKTFCECCQYSKIDCDDNLGYERDSNDKFCAAVGACPPDTGGFSRPCVTPCAAPRTTQRSEQATEADPNSTGVESSAPSTGSEPPAGTPTPEPPPEPTPPPTTPPPETPTTPPPTVLDQP